MGGAANGGQASPRRGFDVRTKLAYHGSRGARRPRVCRLLAAAAGAGAPPLGQDQLDELIIGHRGYLDRRRNARRLNLSMRSAVGLVFAGRRLSRAEMSGALLDWCDFRRADLSDANLFGARLIGADLRQCVLVKADLRGAILRSADLTGALLDQADLRDGALLVKSESGDLAEAFDRGKVGVMSGAVLRGASIKGAKANMSIVRGTDLSYANFSGAKLNGADFSGSLLRGVNFDGANLSNCSFEGANLQGARISGAVLDGARFNEADVTTTVFAGSDVSKAFMSGARLPRSLSSLDQSIQDIVRDHREWVASLGKSGRQADLSRVDLRDVKLDGMDFSAAKFETAMLMAASFRGVILTMADLGACCAIDCILAGADCRGANFRHASLRKADLSGVDAGIVEIVAGSTVFERPARFTEADLSGADLRRGHFVGADFSDAILAGADLRGTVLTGACFAGADLTGADLRDAQLDHADFQDAIGGP